MMEEGVEGVVSTCDDSVGDGLGESVRIESFVAEMSSKVINQYCIWFAHLLKCVKKILRFYTLREVRVGHSDRKKLPERSYIRVRRS